MQRYRFCLAAFNGGVCGAAAAVGFTIRRPQTSLEAARPTLWATTVVVSREKGARKHNGAPHHTHSTSSALIWIVGEGVGECWCRVCV